VCGPDELRFIGDVLTDAIEYAATEFARR